MIADSPEERNILMIIKNIITSCYPMWILGVLIIWPFLVLIQSLILIRDTFRYIKSKFQKEDWTLPISKKNYEEVKNCHEEYKDLLQKLKGEE